MKTYKVVYKQILLDLYINPLSISMFSYIYKKCLLTKQLKNPNAGCRIYSDSEMMLLHIPAKTTLGFLKRTLL